MSVRFKTFKTLDHPEGNRQRAERKTLDVQYRIATRCTIERSNNIVIEGVAYLNPADKHVKVIGQYYALQKALQQLPRKERKPYWDWFFNHSKAARLLRKTK